MKKLLSILLLFIFFLPLALASVTQHMMTVQISLPTQGESHFNHTGGNHYDLVVTSKPKLLLYQNTDSTMKGHMPGSLFRETWSTRRYDELQMPLLKLAKIYFWVDGLSFDLAKHQYTFHLSSSSQFAKNKAHVLASIQSELNFLITCPQNTQPNYGPDVQAITCQAWRIMAINKG